MSMETEMQMKGADINHKLDKDAPRLDRSTLTKGT